MSKENIKEIILKAVYDQRGMGAFNACIDDDAVEFLSDMSEGDARSALNAVELGVLSSEPEAYYAVGGRGMYSEKSIPI